MVFSSETFLFVFLPLVLLLHWLAWTTPRRNVVLLVASLSTWFRDYVYVPLGGNRVPPARVFLNLVIVFALCGLWHG